MPQPQVPVLCPTLPTSLPPTCTSLAETAIRGPLPGLHNRESLVPALPPAQMEPLAPGLHSAPCLGLLCRTGSSVPLITPVCGGLEPHSTPDPRELLLQPPCRQARTRELGLEAGAVGGGRAEIAGLSGIWWSAPRSCPSWTAPSGAVSHGIASGTECCLAGRGWQQLGHQGILMGPAWGQGV